MGRNEKFITTDQNKSKIRRKSQKTHKILLLLEQEKKNMSVQIQKTVSQ